MKVRQTFSGAEYEAALSWPADLDQGPDVVVTGLGTLDPFAFEITEANPTELRALPVHWRDLYNPRAEP